MVLCQDDEWPGAPFTQCGLKREGMILCLVCKADEWPYAPCAGTGRPCVPASIRLMLKGSFARMMNGQGHITTMWAVAQT